MMSRLTKFLRTHARRRAPVPAPVDAPFVTTSQVPPAQRPVPEDDPRGLYLWTMTEILVNTIYEDAPITSLGQFRYDPLRRQYGHEYPSRAHSMIGIERMHSLRSECERVLREGIPGDFIEAGVWRGGATIMMRAVLKAYGITDRRVFVADSFEGVPPPRPDLYPADKGWDLYKYVELAIPMEEVQRNFAKYGLLDDQVVFLKGLFADTLPSAPIETIAVLRIDGDLYESTMDALTSLYDRVSPGGSIAVDDYGCISACKRAVDDFRSAHAISSPLLWIDADGVFWIK
jgi:hypothetical protein